MQPRPSQPGHAAVPHTLSAANFACRLVEPRLHVELPLLMEVLVGDDIVMGHHSERLPDSLPTEPERQAMSA